MKSRSALLIQPSPAASYLPALTLTPDFRQLSVGPLIEDGTCGILAPLLLVSDSVLALQIGPFKELPLGPPPTVLLNKQGRLNAHRQPLGKDEKLPRGRDVITLLVVHLFYVSGSVYRYELSYFDCNL